MNPAELAGLGGGVCRLRRSISLLGRRRRIVAADRSDHAEHGHESQELLHCLILSLKVKTTLQSLEDDRRPRYPLNAIPGDRSSRPFNWGDRNIGFGSPSLG